MSLKRALNSLSVSAYTIFLRAAVSGRTEEGGEMRRERERVL